MTTYTAITNGEIDQDSPVTQPLLTALRDNPIAITEGASGAPVVATGWHPYDMVEVGDGNDGAFYDFSVDGAVTSFVTPDFEDGYEYSVCLDGISHATSVSADLTIQAYLETSGAYGAAFTLITNSISASNLYYANLILPSVRRSLRLHPMHIEYMAQQTVDEYPLTKYGVTLVTDATAQKITRARINTGANTDAGKAYLYRRRNYTTG